MILLKNLSKRGAVVENKKTTPSSEVISEEKENTPLENIAETAEKTAHPDEEHTQTNYRYAFKVLLVLLGIILLIVILKVTGVRFAIKDLFAGWVSFPVPHLPPILF